MKTLTKFFSSKENMALFFISIALAANSFFLVAKKTAFLPFIKESDNFSFIFFIYFILVTLALGTIAFFSNKPTIKQIIKKMIWLFLPTQIIFVSGFQSIACFNSTATCLFLGRIFPLFSVIYFILLAYLLIEYRKKEQEAPAIEKETVFSCFKKWNKKIILTILLVFSINLFFGTFHLAKSARVDEALWTFDRIPKFWDSIIYGEWQKTRISDKPGITVALISGIGMILENPKEYISMHWQGENPESGKSILDMNMAFRLPILLFNALMLFVFYFLTSKLLGRKTAALSTIFIGLSPILLGMSTIINPDSFLWIFVPFSILSYLIYKKDGKHSYLYWSGIFLGLSLLTKYVANILYVFFFLLIFLEYILKEKSSESVTSYLKKSLADYFTLMFFSLLTFMVLLPATWTDINKILEGTLLSQAFEKVWPLFLGLLIFIIIDILLLNGKIMSAILNFFAKYKRIFTIAVCSIFLFFIMYTLLNTYSGMKMADFESILASPKSSYTFSGFLSTMGANFYSLIFGILPLAFLSLIFVPLKSIFIKKIDTEKSTALFLIIFILLYYFASALSEVSSTVRYQIIIYPVALIIAAIGLKQFVEIKKIKIYISEYLVYFLVIIFSIISLGSIKPFYLTYASDLLPDKYVLNLKDMGDGSYEAAQYINSFPGAENMYIWSDKDGVCKFFLGRCTSSLDYKRYLSENTKFDYYVVSAGRESKFTKAVLAKKSNHPDYLIRFDKLYTFENSDFEIDFGGRKNNFVKVIKADKIDLSYDFRLDKDK